MNCPSGFKWGNPSDSGSTSYKLYSTLDEPCTASEWGNLPHSKYPLPTHLQSHHDWGIGKHHVCDCLCDGYLALLGVVTMCVGLAVPNILGLGPYLDRRGNGAGYRYRAAKVSDDDRSVAAKHSAASNRTWHLGVSLRMLLAFIYVCRCTGDDVLNPLGVNKYAYNTRFSHVCNPLVTDHHHEQTRGYFYACNTRMSQFVNRLACRCISEG